MASFVLAIEAVSTISSWHHLVHLVHVASPHIHGHTGLQSLDGIHQTKVATQHKIVTYLCVVSICMSWNWVGGDYLRRYLRHNMRTEVDIEQTIEVRQLLWEECRGIWRPPLQSQKFLMLQLYQTTTVLCLSFRLCLSLANSIRWSVVSKAADRTNNNGRKGPLGHPCPSDERIRISLWSIVGASSGLYKVFFVLFGFIYFLLLQ